MAQMGRPPKPAEVKRRTGNPGGRPLPAPSKLAAVPAIEPDPVDLPAVDTISGVLEAGRAWLAASDTLAVAMLRESLEERATLRERVLIAGAASDRRALRELDKLIISQLSTLGFDPTARARLGVAEVTTRSVLQRLREDAVERR